MAMGGPPAIVQFLPVLFVAFFILVIGLAIYGYFQKQQRQKDLASWSAGHGLTFNPGSDGSFGGRFPAFGCLHYGDNRYAYDVMQGTWQSHYVLAFDYHYETYSTNEKGERQTHHHCFSAAILTSTVPLKPLLIRPEGFLDKVKAFLGFDDINFESAEFSRRFFVQAPDKRWAYDVIHPLTMEFLLAQPAVSLQFDAAGVVAWQDSTLGPVEFEQIIETARGVLDRLPPYLVQQQSTNPAA